MCIRDSLSAEDATKYQWVVSATVRVMENRFRQMQMGIISEDDLAAGGGAANRYWFRSDHFLDYWESQDQSIRWTPEFLDFMETEILGLRGTPSSGGERASAQDHETGFLNRELEERGEVVRYQVYVPRTFDPQREWPLIVYLHGGGAGGSDGMRHTAGGLAEVIRVFGDWFPAVALFPQAAAGENWVGRNADRVTMQIEATLEEFRGDGDRVYLTGQSMGGEGVYYLALRHPDSFAALVVSCGSPFTPPWRLEELGRAPVDRGPAAFDSVAAILKDLPLWVFHGAEDQVVQASEAREVVRALAAIGAEPRYTEYPEQGHDACGRAFFEESLWPWVFEQRRPPSG